MANNPRARADRLLLPCSACAFLLMLTACTPVAAPVDTSPKMMPPASEASASNSTGTVPANLLEVPPPVPDADAASDPPADATPAAAEATLRRYYAAINTHDYQAAYALWADDGAASHQSFQAFAQGYQHTRSVQATVGQAFDPEGAAGSRYIKVPIILATLRSDGSRRHYRGNFTLHAAVADGATPQQRRWHLDSADIEGYEPDLSPAPATATP